MDTNRSTSSNSSSATSASGSMPGSLLPRSFTVLLVLVGPLASVLWLMSQAGHSWLPNDALGPVLLGVLFVWSPMPISIPALIMQDARDAALPQYRGLAASFVRGFLVIPYLMVNKASSIRPEMAASVLGFALACLVVLGLR